MSTPETTGNLLRELAALADAGGLPRYFSVQIQDNEHATVFLHSFGEMEALGRVTGERVAYSRSAHKGEQIKLSDLSMTVAGWPLTALHNEPVQPDEPVEDDQADADPEAPIPAPAELTDAQLAAAEAEDDTPPADCRCEDCEAERNVPLPHRTPDPDAASLLAESLTDGAR